tara:strand:- start:82 stop:312 length:231 start_codon:yes stop_codon:yes gene_type:complete
MALKSTDLPLDTVAETTNTTVNLDFLEKNDKTMIDNDVDFKSVSKGDEVAPYKYRGPRRKRRSTITRGESIISCWI